MGSTEGWTGWMKRFQLMFSFSSMDFPEDCVREQKVQEAYGQTTWSSDSCGLWLKRGCPKLEAGT